MISDDTKTRKDASGPILFGNLPRRIRSDEGVEARLAGFPANLLYSQIADSDMDNRRCGNPRHHSILMSPAH